MKNFILKIYRAITAKKNLKTFLVLSMLLSKNIMAQVSLIPTPNPIPVGYTGQVTITFDATKGTGGMIGATKCYAHTGLITSASSSNSDWKNVIGAWRGATQPQLTSLGDNKWQLVIPNIFEFYGVAESTNIKALAFVFHDGPGGSKEGKTTSGEDIILCLGEEYHWDYKIVTKPLDPIMGSTSGDGYYYNNTVITATPNYGYHFTQWSDGNTDNPREIALTQDTTFTAEFAKNEYTIITASANSEWGTTAGGVSALYLDEIEISATANYGYHFVRWNDNNTSNPRTVSVTEDKTYTATFAKNVYSITTNAEHGSISGNNFAEYLDFVTLTATADHGYHFTQWSDGLKDNPRIAQITQDTTFTAEFAYDRVGTCGKDLALTWSYDHSTKVLTIGNAGSFTENMQFGAEAPGEMEELVIGNNVTAIGENAFANISTLKKVTIGESVKTIHNNAFYNCVNLETIFNYRPTPTNAYSTAFDGVDKFECKLYVLPSSIDMYKNASVWRDFYYTYAIGAEEATLLTNDVKVEPQDNAATVTWPTSENAATYTIEITKDGVVFCTLIFNGNGQLIGIAFAPSRDRQSQPLAAKQVANGLQFTVTGLNSATHYAFSLTAKDSQETVLASYTGEFTTTGVATDIDQITNDQSPITNKIIRNNQIFILRGDKVYTVDGREVK